jgi:hypothetical protein
LYTLERGVGDFSEGREELAKFTPADLLDLYARIVNLNFSRVIWGP